MNIEIDDQLVSVSRKHVEDVLKKKFPGFDINERSLIFKLNPKFLSKDEDGRQIYPRGVGILSSFNFIEDGTTKKFRYFRSKVEQGPGKAPLYSPETIYVRNGEIEVDLRPTAPNHDYGLAFMLLSHPNLSKNTGVNEPGEYHLYRPDEEAKSFLAARERKAAIDTYLVFSKGSQYIKDGELVDLAHALGISAADSYSPSELRRTILSKAEADPEYFINHVQKKIGSNVAIVQKALDMKILVNNPEKGTYTFTYRDDETDFRKKRIAPEPVFKTRPYMMHHQLQDFVAWLDKEDADQHIVTIQKAIDDEVKFLLLHPKRPASIKDEQKAIQKMCSEIQLS